MSVNLESPQFGDWLMKLIAMKINGEEELYQKNIEALKCILKDISAIAEEL